jgi:hypothetical protein
MLTPCGVCQGALSNDDSGHLVRCSGICNRSFHIKCVSISTKVCQYLNSVAGLNWKCESCNNSCFSIDHEGLLKILDTKYNEILGNLKDVFGGLRDDFSKFAKATLPKPSDTDTTSKDVASYSAIVKNKTDPAIIIRPKDSTQSSTITKSDLTKKVNPLDSQLHIRKVKDLRSGDVLVGCSSSEDHVRQGRNGVHFEHLLY